MFLFLFRSQHGIGIGEGIVSLRLYMVFSFLKQLHVENVKIAYTDFIETIEKE